MCMTECIVRSTFPREGISYIDNYRAWATENPYAIILCSFQRRFALNVWAGIVHNHLIVPYLLTRRLDGTSYLVFNKKEVLPELLNRVT